MEIKYSVKKCQQQQNFKGMFFKNLKNIYCIKKLKHHKLRYYTQSFQIGGNRNARSGSLREEKLS